MLEKNKKHGLACCHKQMNRDGEKKDLMKYAWKIWKAITKHPISQSEIEYLKCKPYLTTEKKTLNIFTTR